MTNILSGNLSWSDVDHLAKMVCQKFFAENEEHEHTKIYGVPRGGIYASLLVAEKIRRGWNRRVDLVQFPGQADIIVDDIVDSGKTRDRFKEGFPSIPFYCLMDKTEDKYSKMGWVSFPWEQMNDEGSGPTDAVVRMLEFIGENPNREGLLETPARVIRSWGELYGGYKQNPADLLKSFKDGACDEMVVMRNTEWFSTCEHHLLPFFGRAAIGYLPHGKVVGVSKLARVLEVFTRRCQIQERIGQQITQLLMDELKPLGAGCILTAQHLCMTCRGIQKQHSEMVTSSLRGNFREQSIKDEFLRIAGY